MSNLAQRAARHHRRRMPEAHGEPILFRRGHVTVAVVDAMQSPSTVDIVGADGLVTRVTMIDWWLPADQVLLDEGDASANEPRMGDVITDGNGVQYEPMRPGEAVPAVGSVCGGLFWLVHTKQTGT